jgi:ketosteroid isomerase-like protein
MTELLLLLGGLVASQAEVSDLAAAREAVRRADIEFCRALTAKDAERFKAFIAEEATFYGGASPARGREVVFQGWAHYFAPDAIRSVTWEPRHVEVSRSADLGYTLGEAVFTRREPDGSKVTSRSHYVTIWKSTPTAAGKRWWTLERPPSLNRRRVEDRLFRA